ncbi:amino acid permease [Paenibacillus sp. MER 180]|uniref:Amino acid permease n=1 Tax=Paenibacillus suaedae TaxID=3077233 RepID=A0AAJ2NAB8_9BACL|nr:MULTISPECIES: amino acid permease [unclassified Paenibacillus]MCM3288742.1 amino acid permease [Paenibacillus sp. MER 180]MDT8978494.1 amino acid permease [Paenibacillus sp. chi10]
MNRNDDNKKLRWYNIALIAFVSVWGFGNVVNNYANQGLTVVTSWILIIALYFVPYALMVGQMGSTFKNDQGGVSSWVKETMGPTVAYLAAWTYWVVHIPYLAQKPQGILIALGWTVTGSGNFINQFSTLTLQLICLAVFLVFLWVASRGLNSLKKIGTIAGMSIFIMSLLYIVLAVTAPALTGATIATADMSVSSFIPDFNFAYFTTLSMLVFAVGGAEKISPYVNNTNNPSKEFPRGMLILAGMVAVCALLGSFAMGMMFDSNNIPADLKMNGQYYAFKMLGEYYGIGNTFLVLYAIANTLAQISALAFSIDAPLKVLLLDADKKFVPQKLMKTNERNTPVNGYIMTAVLVGILIVIPAIGIGNMNSLFNWLLDLNSIVMPLRYLWVFAAFMALMKLGDKFQSDYKFVKNRKIGFMIGLWCFVFTAFACIMGMFPKVEAFTSEWYFQLLLNVITPFILLGLGLILPMIARLGKNKR